MSAFIKIYSDGGSRGNPGPSAGAFVVIDGEKILHKDAEFLGTKTNNEAEYFGLIIALQWLKKNKLHLNGKNKLFFYLDSQLVVRQLLGLYRVKTENLKPLFLKVKQLLKEIEIDSDFFSVPRGKNKIADLLVNMEIDENTI